MTISVENTDFGVILRNSSELEEWTPFLRANFIQRPLIIQDGRIRRVYTDTATNDDIPALLGTPQENVALCQVNRATVQRVLDTHHRRNTPDYIVQDMPVIIPVKLTELENGIYTSYGKFVNEFFQSGIDVDLFSDSVSRTTYGEETLGHPSLTVDITKIINARQSPYARTNRYKGFTDSTIFIDTIAPFSLLGDVIDIRERFLQLTQGQKLPTIKISNLYRGGTDGAASAEQIAETRPQRIIKGGYIFRYKMNLKVIDFETKDWKTIQVYNLGIFESPSKIIKYKRSRGFIPNIAKDLLDKDGVRFFDLDKWEEHMRSIYGSHVRYWDGIRKLYPDGLPEGAALVDNLVDRPNIKPEHFKYVTYASQIDTLPEVVEYKKLTDALKSVQSNLNAARETSRRQVANIDRTEEQIREYQSSIQSMQDNVIKFKSALKSSITTADGLDEARQDIDNQLAAKVDVYNKLIIGDQIPENTINQAATWISNLSKSGIIINEVSYYNNQENIYKTLAQDPQIGITSKTSGEYVLNTVEFMTTKPVIINVDQGRYGQDCKKIVGGPYIVRVTASSIGVKLASSTACFGIEESSKSMWVHPHTPVISLRERDRTNWDAFKNLLKNEVHACLGEASPGLYKAFQTNDPKMAVFAAMTWLTNANSTDAWGKNYKYFPRLKDVCLDGNNNLDRPVSDKEPSIEDLIVTEDGMDTIVENMLASISNIQPPLLIGNLDDFLNSAPTIDFSRGIMFLNYSDLITTQLEDDYDSVTMWVPIQDTDSESTHRIITIDANTENPVGITVTEAEAWLKENIDNWDPSYHTSSDSTKPLLVQHADRIYEKVFYSWCGFTPWSMMADPCILSSEEQVENLEDDSNFEVHGVHRKDFPSLCNAVVQQVRQELGMELDETCQTQSSHTSEVRTSRRAHYTPYQAPPTR